MTCDLPARDDTKISVQQYELIARLREHPEYVSATELVFAFEIAGTVDPECLVAAIEEVLQRHPILSWQVGGHGQLAPITRNDDLTPQQAFAQRLLEDRHEACAILSGAPLFRAHLARSEEGLHLGFVVNHLIFDGWSFLAFCRDLSQAYAGGLETQPMPNDYRAYIGAQATISPETVAEARADWRARLNGHSSADPFPATDPAAPSQRHSHTFDATFADGIAACAAHWRTSPFTVLQLLSAQAFAAISGQTQFLLACNSAGRSARFANTLGTFTNTRYTLFDARLMDQPARMIASATEDMIAALTWPPELYMPDVIARLGEIFALKVNFLELPGLSRGVEIGALTGTLTLPDAVCKRHDIPRVRHLLRALDLTWVAQEAGYALEIYHKAPFDEAKISALLAETRAAYEALMRAVETEGERAR